MDLLVHSSLSSDEIIEWIEKTGQDSKNKAIPTTFTPAFPVKYDPKTKDYKIVHCSGKHQVPGFAPMNEAESEDFDTENQIGVIASLRDFLSDRLSSEVLEKLHVSILPNDTFAAGGMVHEGGIIDGTGGNMAMGTKNMECGQYQGFTPMLLDHLVAESMGDENINFEWLFSGKYMYQYLKESVKLFLGNDHVLMDKLQLLDNTKNNIIISDIVFKEDFDINSLAGEGCEFTYGEQVMIKAISTQIMNRAVDAVAQMAVATSRYNTIESRGTAPEQYTLGGDGSLILKTPKFVEAINTRLDELVSENNLTKPVSIVPFDSKAAAEYVGDGEAEISIDATGNGTANFAIASYLHSQKVA